jgi:hypothetical protein
MFIRFFELKQEIAQQSDCQHDSETDVLAYGDSFRLHEIPYRSVWYNYNKTDHVITITKTKYNNLKLSYNYYYHDHELSISPNCNKYMYVLIIVWRQLVKSLVNMLYI